MGVKDSFLGRLLGSADKFTDEQVLQTISLLVENGVKHRATDIHIEPRDRVVLVRYRIDGNLRSTHKLPLGAMPAVAAQIKRLAHLQEDEDLIPQEGQYASLVAGDEFEIQVNTLPVIGGEKIVLHLSRRLETPPSLEDLGFWGNSLQVIHTSLTHSHGLFVVAAPRRNGKTTTMHSMLQLLTLPSVSISTVEHAIEYRLDGASQTIVHPKRGVTFYTGLEAALNQDANVVLISSLPDTPTANTAIQAAIGGHVVITGAHTGNAVTALSHLRAMSSEPFLMATAVRLAVSQRLVRQLCSKCRERYIPSHDQVTEIEKTFGIASPAARRKLHLLEQEAASQGVGGSQHAATDPSRITHLWRASEDGCEACGHTGYRGVVAITEALAVTDSLQKALIDQASGSALQQLALKEGFVPMALDGLVKSLRGQTTVSEVLRATSFH